MSAQRGLFTPPELFDSTDDLEPEPVETDDAGHLLEQEWSRKHRAYVAEHAYRGDPDKPARVDFFDPRACAIQYPSESW